MSEANRSRAMRGSAQNAKPWRSWHRSLRPQSWRTGAKRYLLLHSATRVNPCTLLSQVLCNHRQDRQDCQDFPLALALLPRLLRKCKGSSRPRRLQDRRFFLPNIYLVLLPVCKLCQDAIQRWFFIIARFASVSLRPPPQGKPGTCLKPSAPPRLRLSLCHSTALRPNRYSAPSPCLPRSRTSSSQRPSSHSSRRHHQRRPATPSRQLRPRVLLPTPPRAALPPPILPMRTSSAAGMPATKSLAPQSCSMSTSVSAMLAARAQTTST